MVKKVLFVALSVCVLIFGALLFFGEQFAERKLSVFLKDYLEPRCQCRVSIAKTSLSFSKLSLLLEDITLEDEEQKSFLRRAFIDLSLREVLSRTLVVQNFELVEGAIQGSTEEGPLFRLIHSFDSQEKEVSPKQPDSSFISVRIPRARLQNISILFDIGTRTIKLEKLQGEVHQDKSGIYTIHSSIPSIILQKVENSASSIPLGSFEGSLRINESDVFIDQVLLQGGKSTISGKGTIKNDAIEGNIAYLLSSESFGVEEIVEGTVEGALKVGGTLTAPMLEGKVALIPYERLVLKYNNNPSLYFTEFSFEYSGRLREGIPEFTLSELNAETPQGTLALKTPLHYSQEKISGVLEASFDTVVFGNYAFHDSSIITLIEGSLTSPKITLNASLDRMRHNDYELGPTTLSSQLENNRLVTSVHQKKEGKEVLSLEGTVDVQPVPTVKELSVLLDDYPLPFSSSPIVSGNGSLQGELSFEELQGKFSFETVFPHMKGSPFSKVSLTTILDKNEGKVALQDAQKVPLLLASLKGRKEETLQADLTIPSRKFDTIVPCGEIGLTARYHFQKQNPQAGEGKLTINNGTVGCGITSISINAPHTLQVKDEVLSLNNLTFITSAGNATLQGQVTPKSIDMKLSGKLSLTPLSQLLPSFDELKGTLIPSVTIRRTPSHPEIQGTIGIQDGVFFSEALKIIGERLSGSIVLTNNKASIHSFEGRLNQGTFSLKGEVPFVELDKATLHGTVKDALYYPVNDAQVRFSTDLTISGFGSSPSIEGQAQIEEALFKKEKISLQEVIGTIESLFSSSSSTIERTSESPPVSLKVKVSAPDELFIRTPWAQAELRSGIQIGGTVATPEVMGVIETLYGWFAFGEHKFEITSGKILFRPIEEVPRLEVRAETQLTTPTYGKISVITEMTGPITDPQVAFTSSTGLSQEEVISLLTAGQGNSKETLTQTLLSQIGLDKLQLVGNDSLFGLGKYFNALTQLDKLTVLPSFDPATGNVDPKVLAAKKLSRTFALESELPLASESDLSTVRARYQVAPNTHVVGSLLTSQNQQSSSFAGDISHDLIPEGKSLRVKFYGKTLFEDAQLLKEVNLTENSQVPAKQDKAIARRLLLFYESHGYREAKVTADCDPEAGFCKTLAIHVDPGKQSIISEIEYAGTSLEELELSEQVRLPKIGTPATQEVIDEVERETLSYLREQGYLQAQLTVGYTDTEIPHKKVLRIEGSSGKRIHLIFEGNTTFSRRELLQTINYYTRRFPFGTNTISLLTKRIEERYKREGFDNAQVSYSQWEDKENGELHYLITVHEGERIPLKKIRFRGANGLSLQSIAGDAPFTALMSQKYYSEEAISAFRDLLSSSLRREGYSFAQVTHAVHQDGKKRVLTFTIERGPLTVPSELELIGCLPESPKPPAPPYASAKLAQYEKVVHQSLKDHGYYSPIVTITEISASKAALTCTLGPRARISDIKYLGFSTIKEEVVQRVARLKIGDHFDMQKLGEARYRITRLGLFSDIDVLPLDGSIDSPEETLLIRVKERSSSRLTAGGGYASEFGIHLFANGENRSLFQDGRYLSFESDLYWDPGMNDLSRAVVGMRYQNPFFLNSPYTYSENLYFSRFTKTTQEFEVNKFSLNSQLTRPWKGHFTYSFGHTLEEQNLGNVEPDAVISELDKGTLRLSSLLASIRYRSNPNLLSQQQGIDLFIENKFSLSSLGSEAEYYRLNAEASWIGRIPLLPSTILIAERVLGGASWKFGSTDEIPITERFYAGGRRSVRGFRENSLGPRGNLGSVLGGDEFIANNLEVRYLFTEKLEAHTFFDAGNVFLRSRPAQGLRTSAGFGARYFSPIGPIGIDLGVPLKERSGEPSVRLHLSVGGSF